MGRKTPTIKPSNGERWQSFRSATWKQQTTRNWHQYFVIFLLCKHFRNNNKFSKLLIDCLTQKCLLWWFLILIIIWQNLLEINSLKSFIILLILKCQKMPKDMKMINWQILVNVKIPKSDILPSTEKPRLNNKNHVELYINKRDSLCWSMNFPAHCLLSLMWEIGKFAERIFILVLFSFSTCLDNRKEQLEQTNEEEHSYFMWQFMYKLAFCIVGGELFVCYDNFLFLWQWEWAFFTIYQAFYSFS